VFSALTRWLDPVHLLTDHEGGQIHCMSALFSHFVEEDCCTDQRNFIRKNFELFNDSFEVKTFVFM